MTLDIDIERAMNLLPDEQTRRLDGERSDRDQRYLNNHLGEWRSIYPDQLIAVYDERVVASSLTLEGLSEQLRAAGTPRGAIVQFVDAKPTLYLF